MHGVNHDLGPVMLARTGILELEGRLNERSDLFHWTFPTGSPDAIALRDYIMSLPGTIAANLDQAAVALSMLRKMRSAQTFAIRASMKAMGLPYGPTSEARERMAERDIELRVHALAFYASLGSVIDCLAALVVGLAGMPQSVVRSDLGAIFRLPQGRAWTPSRQRKSGGSPELDDLAGPAVEGFRASLEGAGPNGWVDWLLGQRNTLVHRAHLFHVINFASINRQIEPQVLPPRRPEQTAIESLQEQGQDLADRYLSEDELATADGLLRSLTDATIASVAVLSSKWETRYRTRPPVDWKAQWRSALPDPGFPGYAPGTAILDSSRARIHMHPDSVRRLTNADLITPL